MTRVVLSVKNDTVMTKDPIVTIEIFRGSKLHNLHSCGTKIAQMKLGDKNCIIVILEGQISGY